MPHRKWTHAMTQSQIPGNESYRTPITKDALATAIAGNSNHGKSAKDFQAWFSLQQTHRGWSNNKPYTMGAGDSGGWKVTWTGEDPVVVMATSA